MIEEWRDVKNHEPTYEVSNTGKIRNKITGKELKGWLQKPNKQYSYTRVKVTLDHKSYMFHTIVANAFLDKLPGKTQINHIDNNPLNNNVSNLEWCDQKENNAWKKKQHRGNYKLNLNQEKELIEDIMNKKTISEIREKYNVNTYNVYSIKKRYGINKRIPRKYNINIDQMFEMINNGYSNKDIAEKLNCSTNLVAVRKYQMKRGK